MAGVALSAWGWQSWNSLQLRRELWLVSGQRDRLSARAEALVEVCIYFSDWGEKWLDQQVLNPPVLSGGRGVGGEAEPLGAPIPAETPGAPVPALVELIGQSLIKQPERPGRSGVRGVD